MTPVRMGPGDRARQGRLIGFVAPLVLVVVFAAALAFQALDATRSHREAVAHTLRDYAGFAAFIVTNAARQELERRLTYAFSPIFRYQPESGEPLPPASALGQERVEAQRCATAGVPDPTYYRLDLSNNSLTTAGPAPSASTLQWLADTLRVAAPAFHGDWAFAHIFGDAHAAALIAYRVLHDSAGHALAVYAKTSCFALPRQSLFAAALQAGPALPPFLTGGLANDSLLSVRVTDPHGDSIWASSPQYQGGPSGEAGSAWPQSGGLRLAVTIRPDIAKQLVIGGMPPSRLPMAVLLLALSILFAGYAVLQLRREQELLRLREQFVSNVSHELRTPLQQILMFAELLNMDALPSDAERRHSMQVVERETRRLIQLVENVLQFSRATQGEDTLSEQVVALEPLARETLQAFAPLARAGNARLTLRIERDHSRRDNRTNDCVRDIPMTVTLRDSDAAGHDAARSATVNKQQVAADHGAEQAAAGGGAEAESSPARFVAGREASSPRSDQAGSAADQDTAALVAAGPFAIADAAALRRVLLNLLDNAVKYGPANQTVTVTLTANAEHATLIVDDEGPGIPASERERVWQAFQRLAREEGAAIAGSGMGLAIVHDLVQRMGGAARIEQAPAGGARFIVELRAAAGGGATP